MEFKTFGSIHQDSFFSNHRTFICDFIKSVKLLDYVKAVGVELGVVRFAYYHYRSRIGKGLTELVTRIAVKGVRYKFIFNYTCKAIIPTEKKEFQ